MTLGQKIRNSREDHDLTQIQMADQIPMSQSSYSKIERDVLIPSLEQFKRICEILSLDPRYLLEIDEFEMITGEDIKLINQIKRLYKK